MESQMVAAVADAAINQNLLNSLADDVIDAYEHKLADRPLVVGFS